MKQKLKCETCKRTFQTVRELSMDYEMHFLKRETRDLVFVAWAGGLVSGMAFTLSVVIWLLL